MDVQEIILWAATALGAGLFGQAGKVMFTRWVDYKRKRDNKMNFYFRRVDASIFANQNLNLNGYSEKWNALFNQRLEELKEAEDEIDKK